MSPKVSDAFHHLDLFVDFDPGGIGEPLSASFGTREVEAFARGYLGTHVVEEDVRLLQGLGKGFEHVFPLGHKNDIV